MPRELQAIFPQIIDGHGFFFREYGKDYLNCKRGPMSTLNGPLTRLILTVAHMRIIKRKDNIHRNLSCRSKRGTNQSCSPNDSIGLSKAFE